MKPAKQVFLYLVPFIAILTARYFVVHAAWPSSPGWGPSHGIHQSIAGNYFWVNLIPMCGWLVISILLVLRRGFAACLLAMFLAGFLLCDVVMYLPMARFAGEGLPYDQFLYFVLLATYALFLARRVAIEEGRLWAAKTAG